MVLLWQKAEGLVWCVCVIMNAQLKRPSVLHSRAAEVLKAGSLS